nr:type II toxin-antitoxin system HicB family antitoxin [Pseudorhizobium tarimense]
MGLKLRRADQLHRLIHKEEGSDYGVSFPDFPGVVTAGVTLDEARHLAEEALSFHVEGCLRMAIRYRSLHPSKS